ncbi:uncharacterized protein LOC111258592 isoform X2 [Varroa jacobsoni]|uniref:uncharacterized protein LOC111258592 isoform X2 n=1 Tax=Varroa jacobsoni TaxID=62625 RepID=UPI000BF5178D|nr:uncharacterized protein LOC111258592 isoform X2 [Varroa jacobsoni]
MMLCAPSLSSPLTGAEQLRFRGKKKGHSLLGSAIVVQFSKFFPGKWAYATAVTVDEEMTITYGDLIHSTVALLHDSLLPHLRPQQIFHQLCQERARTLIVLRDIEEAQRDLINSKSSQRLEPLNNNPETSHLHSQMMGSLRVGSIGKPWQKVVPSLSAGSDGNGLSRVASVSSPEEEAGTESDHGINVGGSSSTAPLDTTQSPIDNRQWVSWTTMNRRNKEEILNECGSICSDHPYSDICGDDSSDDDESIPEVDDEGSESNGGPQFARTLESYVKAVQQRKRERIVGVESRLVACATFSKDYRPSGAKVVVLSHIAVKRKFRRYGIGSFMLKRIKSPSLVGPYDAVTLHVRSSDVPAVQYLDVNNANVNGDTINSHPATKTHLQHTCLAASKQVAFFVKNAFSCDIILNSRFHDEEVNVKTGDILLCYLPPFDNGHSPYQHHTVRNINTAGLQQSAVISVGSSTGHLNAQVQQQNSIKAMHEEAQRWREKSLEAYQLQMSYMARLQQEVIRLHEMVLKRVI